MALQGSLDTFALPDVLRLLAATAKTGRLRIEGDGGRGNVWLRDGTVMAATADRAVEDASAEEVLFELLRFQEGSFAFDMGELSPNGEQPEDVEILLRNAGALLTEWSELESIVPSLDHQVALVQALPKGDVTIDSQRWPSLVAVASGRSVRDVAARLSLSELAATRAVRDLVDIGVAEIREPVDEPVRPARSEASRSARAQTSRSARSETSRSARSETSRSARSETSRSARSETSRNGRADVSRNGRAEVSRDEMARRSPFSTLGSGEELATSPGREGPATGNFDLQGATWLEPPDAATGSQPAALDGPSPRDNGARGGASNGTGPRPSVPGSGSSTRGPGSRSGNGSSRSSGARRTASSASSASSTGAGSSGPDGGRSRPSRPSSTRDRGAGRSAGTGRAGGASRASGPGKRSGRSAAGSGTGSSGRMSGAGRDASGESRRPVPPLTPPNGEVPSRVSRTRPGTGSRRNGGPSRPVRPTTGPLSMPPLSPSDFDGRLGPSPLPPNTGQIRAVPPSAMPPDLQWAADDGTIPPIGRFGPPTGGLPSLGAPAVGNTGGMPMMGRGPVGGPPGMPLDPNNVAPHVAAMSPEARAAVQVSVGNAGGAAHALGPGDEAGYRGHLLSFLSSVRS